MGLQSMEFRITWLKRIATAGDGCREVQSKHGVTLRNPQFLHQVWRRLRKSFITIFQKAGLSEISHSLDCRVDV